MYFMQMLRCCINNSYFKIKMQIKLKTDITGMLMMIIVIIISLFF